MSLWNTIDVHFLYFQMDRTLQILSSLEKLYYYKMFLHRKLPKDSPNPGCACFAKFACELTKSWSSGATEFGV